MIRVDLECVAMASLDPAMMSCLGVVYRVVGRTQYRHGPAFVYLTFGDQYRTQSYSCSL